MVISWDRSNRSRYQGLEHRTLSRRIRRPDTSGLLSCWGHPIGRRHNRGWSRAGRYADGGDGVAWRPVAQLFRRIHHPNRTRPHRHPFQLPDQGERADALAQSAEEWADDFSSSLRRSMSTKRRSSATVPLTHELSCCRSPSHDAKSSRTASGSELRKDRTYGQTPSRFPRRRAASCRRSRVGSLDVRARTADSQDTRQP